MTAELLSALLRSNLAAGVAILVVLALRAPVRGRFGARVAYLLWAAPALAALASLIPARRAAAIAREAPTSLMTPAIDSGLALGSHAGDPFVRFDWGPALLGLWLAGVALSLAILAWRQRQFLASLGGLTPWGDGKAVFVAARPGVGPAVVGALAPRIVLPSDFESRFSADEQAFVLAHERAHLAAGDGLVNGLAALALCLAWFNPLVHLAVLQLKLDQELACDEAVVARRPGARRGYAEALLKTQAPAINLPLGCYWPLMNAKALKLRIGLLKQGRPPVGLRVAGFALTALLCVGSGLAAWAAQPARAPLIALKPPPHHRASLADQALGEALVDAVKHSDHAAAHVLIAVRADVNHHARGDGTPLVEAARGGDLGLVEALLDAGADPNLASPGDGSPLIAAAVYAEAPILELLIARGANVDGFAPYDETPLINAAREGRLPIVALLLDHGADANLGVPAYSWPETTRSPLGEARRFGRREVADYLIARGARR